LLSLTDEDRLFRVFYEPTRTVPPGLFYEPTRTVPPGLFYGPTRTVPPGLLEPSPRVYLGLVLNLCDTYYLAGVKAFDAKRSIDESLDLCALRNLGQVHVLNACTELAGVVSEDMTVAIRRKLAFRTEAGATMWTTSGAESVHFPQWQ